ncbi:MAG: TM2 domain-containing protein [Planctomycetaceae bacterium]|jgi:TM2 domain-containing membrane protein YozV|nr:TM2 domain-containing protein [Planctomycetaceae bacterium]
MYCANCGNEVHEKAVVCVKCGCEPFGTAKSTSARRQGGKSKVAAGLLALILGRFGAHKFYHGSWGWGLVYLVPLLILPGMFFGFSGLCLNYSWEKYDNYKYQVDDDARDYAREEYEKEYDDLSYSEQKECERQSYVYDEMRYWDRTWYFWNDMFGCSGVIFGILQGVVMTILPFIEALVYFCGNKEKYHVRYNERPKRAFKW